MQGKCISFGGRGINPLDISVMLSPGDMVELEKQDLLTHSTVVFKLA